MTRTIQSGFLASAARHPERPALAIGGAELSYRELHAFATRVAATLLGSVPAPLHPLTGILASRTATAYGGILGALLRGHGYVPLDPGFPPERLATMLNRSEIDAVVVDRYGAARLPALLALAERPLTVLFPEDEPNVTVPAPHRLIGPREHASGEGFTPAEVGPDAIANLLFTSGSTGVPKAVMVAQRNLVTFLDWALARYDLRPEDRFSNLFNLTFDLHGFDLFGAWWSGACVCCPTRAELLVIHRFFESAKLTVWFSVPTSGMLVKKVGLLKPGGLPQLRVSLFCGEALPAELARAWAEAAPGSIVENLYGPTELTLACTAYRWDAATSPAECNGGVVPIGEPFPGMTELVAGEGLVAVPPGEIGELLVAGPQVTLGYWHDAEKTAAAFVVPPGQTATHYRTGDLAKRPPGGPLLFVGRVDSQVKVRGFRVELGDVEAALRAAAGVDLAVALGFPQGESGFEGIVAFVAGTSMDEDELRAGVAARVPPFMVPSTYYFLEEFPLNANGKVDKKVLAARLAADAAGSG